MLSPQDIDFDLEQLNKMVIATTKTYYKLHLNDILQQSKRDAVYKNIPWLMKFPLMKYYNLESHIPELKYDEEASLAYEHKNGMQYRINYVSIDRSKYKTEDDYPNFQTKDGVIVYYPYLRVSVNVKDYSVNTFSIFTVGMFKNLPPPNINNYYAEYKTTLKVKIPIRADNPKVIGQIYKTESTIIQEVYRKYFPHLNLNNYLILAREFLSNNLSSFLNNAESDFQQKINKLQINSLNNIKISPLILNNFNFNDINYDDEISSKYDLSFSNIEKETKLEPILFLPNGVKIHKPNITIGLSLKKEIKNKKDNKIDKITIATVIVFDEIPTYDVYYKKTGTRSYIFSYSEDFTI